MEIARGWGALLLATAFGVVCAADGAAGEAPAASVSAPMHAIDFNGAAPGAPWTAKLTGKAKDFKRPNGYIAGVKGWRAHVGGEKAKLDFSLGIEKNAGASGKPDDHAARLSVANANMNHGFWYSSCRWSVPPLLAPPPDEAGKPDLSALSLTADVKIKEGARFSLTLRFNRQQAFVFQGTGTGAWQSVGGTLDRAEARWKDPEAAPLDVAGYGVAVEFAPGSGFLPDGVAWLDNIRVGPLSGVSRMRPPIPAPLDENRSRPLRVVGNKVLDDRDHEIWLQGVNIAGLEWMTQGENTLKSTEESIKNWNANIIRLPVSRDRWFGEHPDQEDGGAGYLKLVNDVIEYASRAGTYIILDLHRYRMPGRDDVLFWQDACLRYANNPTVLFGLLNEPHGISWDVWKNGGTITDKPKDAQGPEDFEARAKVWEAVGFQELLDAVRATGAKNVCVIGALDWAYDLTGILNGYALTDRGGHGIIYDAHVYPWKSGWDRHVGDIAAVHPVLLGEVGADVKGPDIGRNAKVDHLAWSKDILGYIQAKRLHWTGWCFHPRATPRMIEDWTYKPTPTFGAQAKAALAGQAFPPGKVW